MFHAQNGLFFRRASDGSVFMLKTFEGRDPRKDNVVIEEKLDASCWASIVASMSERGENAATYAEALSFHERRK